MSAGDILLLAGVGLGGLALLGMAGAGLWLAWAAAAEKGQPVQAPAPPAPPARPDPVRERMVDGLRRGAMYGAGDAACAWSVCWEGAAYVVHTYDCVSMVPWPFSTPESAVDFCAFLFPLHQWRSVPVGLSGKPRGRLETVYKLPAQQDQVCGLTTQKGGAA